MKDQYYADHRDLVKWSVLIRLAEQYGLSQIIQVAYLRPSIFSMVDIGGQEMELPSQVLSHFRNILNITTLHHEHISINVFDHFFDNRQAYHDAVTQYLTEFEDELRLIFLDPDTGLEPLRRYDFKHVRGLEVHSIWSQLRPNEVFAFYQHKTNMADIPWIEEKRSQLASAIGVGESGVMVGQSRAIANDVVIYYAIKP